MLAFATKVPFSSHPTSYEGPPQNGERLGRRCKAPWRIDQESKDAEGSSRRASYLEDYEMDKPLTRFRKKRDHPNKQYEDKREHD